MRDVPDRKDSVRIPPDFDAALSGLLKVNPRPMLEQKAAKKSAKKNAEPKKRG
jgi:hypothetical protein